MTKQLLIIVGLVAVLLMSSIGYMLFKKYDSFSIKKPVPQVVTTVTNTTASTTLSTATSTAGIIYTSIDLYKEGENSASYIKIQGGVPDIIKDKINTELFKRSSCFAESDEYLRDSLLHEYDFPKVDTKPPYTKVDIAKMNTETLRKNLFIYGHFDELSNQEVVYADKNLFSVEGHYQNYCGGAYPNHSIDAMNFDLQTGKEISFADLFKDFEKDRLAIKEVILKSLPLTVYDDPSECSTEYLHFKYIDTSLTKEGFKIRGLGYPHVAQACEPIGVVPYKVLLPYMNTNLLYLKGVIK